MRLEGSEVPGAVIPPMRRAANEIARRTGLSYAYRRSCGDLYFYHGDPSRGVWGIQVRFPLNERGWLIPEVEMSVRHLNTWKAKPETKRSWVEEAERLDKEKTAADQAAFFDDRRPDAKDHFKKLRTNRNSTTVQGLRKSRAKAVA